MSHSLAPSRRAGGVSPLLRRVNKGLTLPARLLIALLVAAGPVAAEPSFTFDAPKKAALANLTPVVAPAAQAVAVSDGLGLLAFGHDRTHEAANVSLVKLDGKGVPAAYATAWKLPRPEALAKFPNYVLGLAFHPKLPLLYVWQDVAVPFGNPPGPPAPGLDKFDHLLVYDVSQQPPTLVTALVRGTAGILYGQHAGGLAVDRDGAFLYVPNFTEVKSYGHFCFGRFPLDADGLPELLEAKDAKLGREARRKRLAERNAAGPLLPSQQTPTNQGMILCYSQHGAGASFVPVSAEAVLSGGGRGLVLWRPGDKEVGLNALPLKGVTHVLLGAHPALPLVYATSPDQPTLFRVRHADGYPTLLPELWAAPTRLTSAPVVLGKAGKLAVGSANVVYVVDLDAEGRPQPALTQVPVFNRAVRALAYSERFDRVYVSVEVSK